MKKRIIAVIIAVFIAIPVVKADETQDTNVYNKNEEIIQYIYNNLMTEYQNIQYPYYSIIFDYGVLSEDYEVENNSQSYITGYLYYFEKNNNYNSDKGRIYIDYMCRPDCMYTTYRETKGDSGYGAFNNSILELSNNFRNYAGNMLLEGGETPNYFVNSIENQYIEVNLDNYNYVILTLKNYNQTKAFQTNLQVKGQVGITPIYNYGQTTKDSVTGVKVQDRCNVKYESYTNYPFYILQSDLQNNAVYVVKECSSNSSFKYNNTIFDITYITQENEENPQVVINGKTYDVIPYDELPSTATQNEEENYIPGESGSANDTGGLDSAIKNAQNKLSEIWNTITYFTDFIGQIFSSLPDEVRAILISGFTIMVVLGVIKIFLGK